MLSIDTIDKVLNEFDYFSCQYVKHPYWFNTRELNSYREFGYRSLLWLQHRCIVDSDIRVKKINDMLNECSKIQMAIISTYFRGE